MRRASDLDRIGGIQLLARLDVVADRATLRHRFATILALGRESLVLETNDAFEVGEPLGLEFHLPGDATGGHPRLSLPCVVRSVLDETKLHYEAAIDALDPVALRQIDRFIENRAERTED